MKRPLRAARAIRLGRQLFGNHDVKIHGLVWGSGTAHPSVTYRANRARPRSGSGRGVVAGFGNPLTDPHPGRVE